MSGVRSKRHAYSVIVWFIDTTVWAPESVETVEEFFETATQTDEFFDRWKQSDACMYMCMTRFSHFNEDGHVIADWTPDQ
jgi:hypothetical protein